MKYPYRYFFASLWIGIFVTPAFTDVEYRTNVEHNMSGTDSLNDVFPATNVKNLPEDRRTSCFVDGSDGNSVVVPHRKGPAYITFDIAPDGGAEQSELKSLKLWIYGLSKNYQGHPPNFVGRLSVSKDGKTFQPVANSEAKLIAPRSKRYNAVFWTFRPGEVKGFRFLRIESLGYKGQTVRIAEIDADISGVTIPKSTRIVMTAHPISGKQITRQPPKTSQTVPAPMRVRDVRFEGTALTLVSDGTKLFDLRPIFLPSDSNWKIISRKHVGRTITCVGRRDDGLERTVCATIDKQNRLTLTCVISLPQTAARQVEYETTTLDIHQADVMYDGVTCGSMSAYFPGASQASLDIGAWSAPYLIFPCMKRDLEVQFFMPDWYNVMGRMDILENRSLARWNFYAATKNTQENIDNTTRKITPNRWHPVPKTFQPGDSVQYKMHVGVFDISPRTLGQIDIEDYPHLPPLKWIDTGEAGQRVQGNSIVLHRDKMLFMGFKLPKQTTTKIGHSIVDSIHDYQEPGLLDRLEKAGVGLVILMANEFVDVSHGISHGGDYDKHPEKLPGLLAELDRRGIKAVCWFSPRGFLNQPWLGRPRDKLIDQHPDWFLEHAHWGGKYQTLDSFHKKANQWIIQKFRQDLQRFSTLDGFAFDSFPRRGAIVGSKGETVTSREQHWLRTFSKVIHDVRPGTLVLANGATPIYDDYLYYDYTVSENSLLMYLNEVTGGHVPFGRPFTAFTQWGQLYGWWVTLSHMHHNFCDYDQGLGWMHSSWMGWRAAQAKQARKDLDRHVIPLWYIMGKGKRIYAAEIGPYVRQIEVRMPDGSLVVIVSSKNPSPKDVQVVPRHLSEGTYNLKITTDTCIEHKECKPFRMDTRKTPGISLLRVPAYSITVFRFDDVSKTDLTTTLKY